MHNEKLDHLLLHWQEQREQGSNPTPEDVCRDCPELLEAFRERAVALASREAFLKPADGPASTHDYRSLGSTSDGAGDTIASGVPTGPQRGRFTIVKPHAKGGLGQVSIARDEKLRRQVALKEIRSERAGDPYLRQRFVTEAEITGQLDHPGIVPIYALDEDAAGQPYYAMRFIQGRTLGEAIREYHAAPTPLAFRELLTRFVSVCQTLGYAHSKGVIHRDLKPANVMLGDYGETLVVDWGLAKEVRSPEPGVRSERTDDSLSQSDLTQAGQVLGTPAYMSPEQAAGQADRLGPATDIYALGAILYELLSGKPPYSPCRAARELLDKLKRGEAPTPPGQIQTSVPRALEAVCRKAMSASIDDRYATAAEIAQEIDRYLADEPVTAWREPLGVRAKRWMRRHQTAVVGGGATIAVAAAALAVVTLLVSGHARTLSEKNSQISHQSDRIQAQHGELVSRNADLQESNTKLATQTAAAEAARADEAQARERSEGVTDYLVKTFRSPDPSRAGRTISMAEVLDRSVKDLEDKLADQPLTKATLLNAIAHSYQGLGLYFESIPILEQALDLRQTNLGTEHSDTLASMNNLGLAYSSMGRLDQALPLLEKALSLKKLQSGPQHSETLSGMNNLAGAYVSAGKFDLAVPLLEETLQIMQSKMGRQHLAVLGVMNNLSAAYLSAGKLDQALPLAEETLTLVTAQVGPDHPQAHKSRYTLASACQDAGHFARALSLYQDTLHRQEATLGPEHPDTLASMNNVALHYLSAKDLQRALPIIEDILQRRRAKLGPEHPDTLASINDLAGAYQSAGRLDRALPLLQEALELRSARLGEEHPATLTSLANLGGAYQSAGMLDRAMPLLEESLKLRKRKLGSEHPATLISMNNLAGAYQSTGKLELAIALFEEALQLSQATLGRDHPQSVATGGNLANACLVAERFDRAIPLFEERLKHMQAILGPDHPDTVSSMGTLAIAYLVARQPDRALPLFETFLQKQRRILAGQDVQFAGLLSGVSRDLVKHGQFVQAEAYLRDSLAIRQQSQSDDWALFNTQSLLGAALAGQMKLEQAEPLLIEGYAGLKARQDKIPAGSKVRLTEALQRLVDFYTAWDKPEEAARWRNELKER